MFGNVYRRCSVHRKLSREANSPTEISITRFHDNTSHPATFPFTNSNRHSLFLSPFLFLFLFVYRWSCSRDFRLSPFILARTSSLLLFNYLDTWSEQNFRLSLWYSFTLLAKSLRLLVTVTVYGRKTNKQCTVVNCFLPLVDLLEVLENPFWRFGTYAEICSKYYSGILHF